MSTRGSRDPLSGVRTEMSGGGVRFLSEREKSHYAAIALEAIARVRPDIEPDELMPVRALELDNDEMLLEYARQRAGIPFYRGPRLFLRIEVSGEFRDLQTDWAPCRFDDPDPDAAAGPPPDSIGPPEEASCLRGAYSLDASGVRPFYLFPPRAYDRTGQRIGQSERLGPWEWIDLRGSASAKRSPAAPIRPPQASIPPADSRRPEQPLPLERDEMRRVRAAVLDYLLRGARPRAYRWAFLAGRERSSFRPLAGGFVHVRLYRLVNGLPVLGACLDLYVERRTGRLSAASDELHFRRVRSERFAEVFAKPRLSPAEAWNKLRGQIRILPYYALGDGGTGTGTGAGDIKQASLMWVEESEFVCEAVSGELLRAEPVRL